MCFRKLNCKFNNIFHLWPHRQGRPLNRTDSAPYPDTIPDQLLASESGAIQAGSKNFLFTEIAEHKLNVRLLAPSAALSSAKISPVMPPPTLPESLLRTYCPDQLPGVAPKSTMIWPGLIEFFRLIYLF